MAKKKRSKISRYKSRRKRNGEDGIVAQASDLGIRAGAGFGGYVAGRFVSRAVYQMALQRFPKLAKHGAVVAGVGSAIGSAYALKKWDKLDEYKDEVILGASIAALQTLAQAYLPKHFAWLASDFFHGPYANKSQAEKDAEKQTATAMDPLGDFLPPLDDIREPAPAPKPRAALPAPRSQPAAPQPAPEPAFDLDAFMAANDLEEAPLDVPEPSSTTMDEMADLAGDESMGGFLH